jgi:hypothetical protein
LHQKIKGMQHWEAPQTRFYLAGYVNPKLFLLKQSNIILKYSTNFNYNNTQERWWTYEGEHRWVDLLER